MANDVWAGALANLMKGYFGEKDRRHEEKKEQQRYDAEQTRYNQQVADRKAERDRAYRDQVASEDEAAALRDAENAPDDRALMSSVFRANEARSKQGKDPLDFQDFAPRVRENNLKHDFGLAKGARDFLGDHPDSDAVKSVSGSVMPNLRTSAMRKYFEIPEDERPPNPPEATDTPSPTGVTSVPFGAKAPYAAPPAATLGSAPWDAAGQMAEATQPQPKGPEPWDIVRRAAQDVPNKWLPAAKPMMPTQTEPDFGLIKAAMSQPNTGTAVPVARRKSPFEQSFGNDKADWQKSADNARMMFAQGATPEAQKALNKLNTQGPGAMTEKDWENLNNPTYTNYRESLTDKNNASTDYTRMKIDYMPIEDQREERRLLDREAQTRNTGQNNEAKLALSRFSARMREKFGNQNIALRSQGINDRRTEFFANMTLKYDALAERAEAEKYSSWGDPIKGSADPEAAAGYRDQADAWRAKGNPSAPPSSKQTPRPAKGDTPTPFLIQVSQKGGGKYAAWDVTKTINILRAQKMSWADIENKLKQKGVH